MFADHGVEALGQAVDPVEQAGPGEGGAQSRLVGVGAGQAQVLPDGAVEDVRVLRAQADHPADVLAGEFAGVDGAGQPHAAGGRLDEAQQDVREGGLAGAGRADHGDPPAGPQFEVDAAQRVVRGAGPTGGQSADDDRELGGGQRLGRGRFGDRERRGQDFGEAFLRGAGALPEAHRGGHRGDGLERGQRGEHHDGQADAGQRPGGDAAHADRGGGDHRQAGHQGDQAGGERAGGGGAPGQPGQRGVGGAGGAQPGGEGAGDGQFGGAGEGVEDGGGQFAPGGGVPAFGAAGDPAFQGGDAGAGEQQAEGEDESGEREERGEGGGGGQ